MYKEKKTKNHWYVLCGKVLAIIIQTVNKGRDKFISVDSFSYRNLVGLFSDLCFLYLAENCKNCRYTTFRNRIKVG